MHFIGFDVATKSLAVSIIKVEPMETILSGIKSKFDEYKKKMYGESRIAHLSSSCELLSAANILLSSRYKIIYLDVVDLIPNKKLKQTTTIERTLFLNKFFQTKLRDILIEIPQEERIFLIEYQMGPNDKSRVISSQIALFCAMFCSDRIEDAKKQIYLVGPSLKNTIFFRNDEKSHHSYHIQKYKTNYAANKNHTKYLLKKLVELHGQSNILKDISAKNMDDAADAVCMTIAYILKNGF